jgi:FkbM family methyltransferase
MFEFGLRFFLRQKVLEPLVAGQWWHPRYFRWRSELKKFPELDNETTAAAMRSVRYSPCAARFLKEDGTQHLLNHNLTQQSLVLDVGSYTGEWTREIYARYQPRILAFEPVTQFYLEMKSAFADQPKVSVYNFGLSDSNRKASMDVCGMGSSEFSSGKGWQTVEVEIRDVLAVFQELQIEAVDVLKINIEGGEFPLLERMLECNLLARCNKIMVQFHKYVLPTRQAIRWREKLVTEIERTHAPIFSFPFLWEGWLLRQPGRAGASS